MSKKQVPERVKLREERRWIPFHWDSIRDVDPEGEWVPYKQRQDAELDVIIANANGNATKALEGWRRSVERDLCNKHDVHLIPGQIQELLELPVRQVYLHDDEVYRIEADGRVTTRLIESLCFA